MSSSTRSLDPVHDQRPQFTIREVLLTTLVVAIGLLLYRLQQEVWPGALQFALALLSVGIVLSLIAQIRDFRRELCLAGLSREARWGLRFAITSRIVAIMLLATYHISEDVLMSINPHVFIELGVRGWSARIHYYLALVIVLAGTRQLTARRRDEKHVVLRYVGFGVLVVIGAAVLSYLLREWLRIHYLVHNALARVESEILLTQGIDTPPAQRAEQAFWLGLGTTILVPLTYLLIYLSVRENSSPRSRTLARGALAIVFPAFAGMFLWNYFVALPRASPHLIAQAPSSGLLEIFLVGLPCFLILTTAIAHRWSARTTAPRPVPGDEPANRGPYLHERRWFLALFAMTLTMAWAFAYSLLLDPQLGGYWENVAAVWAYDTAHPALVAVLMLAVSAVFARWTYRHHLPPTMPLELPPARFLFIWFAVAATTLVALPVLASYGFSLCLAPWYF